MLQNLRNILQQPFPDRNDFRSFLKTAIWSGVIITGLLYFLRPFGLSNVPSPLLPCILFGAITTATALLLDLFIAYVLKIDREHPSWTLWKWIVNVSILIFLIAIVNYWLDAGFVFGRHSLAHFLRMLAYTFLLGIIPTVMLGAFSMISHLKSNQALAQSAQQSITPRTDDRPATTSSPHDDILYVESMQNYVSVYRWNGTQVEKKMTRTTMSKTEELLASSSVKRCHRSYMVNTDKITTIEGNAQGLRVSVAHVDDKEIPVSRKYLHLFRS